MWINHPKYILFRHWRSQSSLVGLGFTIGIMSLAQLTFINQSCYLSLFCEKHKVCFTTIESFGAIIWSIS